MGTYYPLGMDRRSLMDSLSVDRDDYRKRYCSGNTLWVWHSGKGGTDDWIGCYLLTCYQGEWGYKPMDESMHPFYYSCPKSWFTDVPAVCEEWRAGVISHWERKAERRRAKRKPMSNPRNRKLKATALPSGRKSRKKPYFCNGVMR